MTEVTVPPPNHGHERTPIGDLLDEGWDHLTHVFTGHHHNQPASPETTPPPATIKTTTQEDPMISIAELETDAKNLAAKFAEIDGEAVAKLDAVRATPEGAAAFDVLHSIYTADVPAGVRSVVAAVLSGLVPAPVAVGTPAPAPETAAQPAFAAGGQA